MPTVKLRFAAMPGHVRTARMIATAVSRRAGVPAGAIDEIKLAVGEACARAVQVNRRSDPHAMVHVTLTDTADTFAVTVTDCGRPGDDMPPSPNGGLVSAPALLALDDPIEGGFGDVLPATAPAAGDPVGDPDEDADVEAFPPGLGLALIEGLVDEVDVRRGAEGVGTVVEMIWHTGGGEHLTADGFAALAAEIAGSTVRGSSGASTTGAVGSFGPES